MSSNKIAACCCILRDCFDEQVEIVGKYLAENGPSQLRNIASKTELGVDEVKTALRFLIRNNIVTFDLDSAKRFALYTINLTNILAVQRYGRFANAAKVLYGFEAELIIREILCKGQCSLDEVIAGVVEKLADQNNVEKRVYEKFVQLAQAHFIQQCPLLVESEQVEMLPVFKINQQQMYSVPPFSNKGNTTGESSSSRQHNDQAVSAENSNTKFWRINIDRFNEYMRDQTIISAIANRVDPQGAKVVKAILRLSELKNPEGAKKSVPIALYDIVKELPREMNFTPELLKKWLKVLTEVAVEFIRREGDSGGGQYTIHFQRAFVELCKAHIESVVQERYGKDEKRIMRVLMMKKQLEIKQIEEFVMTDLKDTHQFVYRLLKDNLITSTEVPRSSEFVPRFTYYLFSVNILQVAQTLLDQCYKTLANLITRRFHETKENKRLLDKQMRIEAILASCNDPAQREEFEQQMAPSEKEQIENCNRILSMLQQAEQEMDETIFVFETYITYAIAK